MNNPVQALPEIRTVEDHIARIQYRFNRDEPFTAEEKLQEKALFDGIHRRHMMAMGFLIGISVLMVMLFIIAAIHGVRT